MIIVRVMKRALLTCLAGAAVLAGVWLPRAQAKSQTLNVVAAESVYGNIVAQIGGAHVAVTSILDDPNADPHLYEPGTSNALAVAKAKVVIQNGLGYDAFMSRLESASPNSHRNVITISDVLGINGKNANPHLWYDVPGAEPDRRRDRRRARAGRPHERRAATSAASRDSRRALPHSATRSPRSRSRLPASPLRTPSRFRVTCWPRRASGTWRPTRSRGRSRTAASPHRRRSPR